MNISKSKNWKNGENTGNFSNFEKQKMQVLGNVSRKANAIFQEASSIEITNKLMETIQWRDYFQVQELQERENSEMLPKFDEPKIWILRNVIKKAHAKFQEVSPIGSINSRDFFCQFFKNPDIEPNCYFYQSRRIVQGQMSLHLYSIVWILYVIELWVGPLPYPHPSQKLF